MCDGLGVENPHDYDEKAECAETVVVEEPQELIAPVPALPGHRGEAWPQCGLGVPALAIAAGISAMNNWHAPSQ
jgi:hypothetical protein